jgi:hypothetical protein
VRDYYNEWKNDRAIKSFKFNVPGSRFKVGSGDFEH